MRRPSRREITLLGALAVAILATSAWLFRQPPSAPAPRVAVKGEAALPIPQIDLARLSHERGSAQAGRRNIFGFGPEQEPEPVSVAPPQPVVVAPAPSLGDAAGGMGGAAALAALNVRYIGSVENALGIKVAVLVTDRREVLTGQAGEVVANRYRIARIGLESVDLEDVGTGQSRRIPLRGGS